MNREQLARDLRIRDVQEALLVIRVANLVALMNGYSPFDISKALEEAAKKVLENQG